MGVHLNQKTICLCFLLTFFLGKNTARRRKGERKRMQHRKRDSAGSEEELPDGEGCQARVRIARKNENIVSPEMLRSPLPTPQGGSPCLPSERILPRHAACHGGSRPVCTAQGPRRLTHSVPAVLELGSALCWVPWRQFLSWRFACRCVRVLWGQQLGQGGGEVEWVVKEADWATEAQS
uniref:Uncharacterized protein n=1 Tax=Pipistrellus kuhlii TaxID=59472 RepID=A0A7J7VN64_PIPKU|nr:hypothetical protein mPipKuh1_008436 [Pipistrellus kuhlii]